MMNNNNNLKNLNIDITKNDYKDIIIDKRFLPLFKTPIILKQLNEKKRNKYNIILKNQGQNLNFRIITLKEILEIFLKGIYLYSYNLNNYLKKYNNKELILQLKNDEIYKLNNRISNYIYIIKKFIPLFKIRTLIYKIRLFLPKGLLKPHPYIKFRYRFRNIAKIYKVELMYNNKRDRKIQRRQINKLLDKGKEIITEIETQIIQKQNLINSLKNKNKILKILKSLLPTVTDNNNNNKKMNKSYHYSGSVEKGIIKEAVQGVVEGNGNIVPVVVGGIAGAGLWGAIIKSTSGLPPLQKAGLGVATAIGGSLGVSVSSAVGKEIVKNIIKKN